MPSSKPGSLPRLLRASYRGFASVHWTHCIERRSTGWLTPSLHCRFRELTLHALHRENLACPAYVLMPDHFHLLVTGLDESSNQLNFTRYLRRHLFQPGSGFSLQKQGYDHVLRREETQPAAFATTAEYILQNPVRKKLVKEPFSYSYSGCLFPGYVDLDHRQPDYWTRYWRIYNRIVSR